VPPFVGAAVNVTLVPAQMVLPGFAEIATLAGRFGFTVVVMEFDVAGEPVAQTALEVITTVTICPFVSVVVVNVGLLVPAFTPFTFH